MSCYKQQVLPLVKIEKRDDETVKKGLVFTCKKKEIIIYAQSKYLEALIPNSRNGKKCAYKKSKDKFRYRLLTANLLGLGL